MGPLHKGPAVFRCRTAVREQPLLLQASLFPDPLRWERASDPNFCVYVDLRLKELLRMARGEA
jgi:hypothetical protein